MLFGPMKIMTAISRCHLAVPISSVLILCTLGRRGLVGAFGGVR